MNGRAKHEATIEQYERAKTAKEQRECMFTLLKTIARNDMPHIWKFLWVLLVLQAVNLLKPDGWDVTGLINFLVKAFG